VTAQYYFLVASLPGLSFSAPAPVTRAYFLHECQQHLSGNDFAELSAVLEHREEEARSAFARDWFNCNRQMRNAIVHQRASRLAVEGGKYCRAHSGYRMDLEVAVTEAFARANPLEREMALDRVRWNLADELNGGDVFGLTALLSYGIKLSILARWQSLSAEKGQERLDETVGVVGVSSEEVAGWSGLAQM